MGEARFRILEMHNKLNKITKDIEELNQMVKEDKDVLLEDFFKEKDKKRAERTAIAEKLKYAFQKLKFCDYEKFIKINLPLIMRFFKIDIRSTCLKEDVIMVEFYFKKNSDVTFFHGFNEQEIQKILDYVLLLETAKRLY